jgi:hypothetical protein
MNITKNSNLREIEIIKLNISRKSLELSGSHVILVCASFETVNVCPVRNNHQY